MKNRIFIENKFHFNCEYFDKPKKFNDFLLYQLGEIFTSSNATVESHKHDDFFELTYIISGKGKIITNYATTEVRENDLYLSLPYDTHEIISDNIDPLRYYFFAFNFEPSSTYYSFLHTDSIIKLDNKLRKHNSVAIKNFFVDLLSQLETDSLFSDIKLELIAKYITIDIIQIYNNISTHDYNSPVVNNEQTIFFKIINYIDNNIVSINQLTDISKNLNYNYAYLSRIFKKTFGESINTYCSSKKIEIAKSLLEENKLSVTKISEYLNFSSLYVFSRIFKNKVGISPSIYKVKHQIKDS